MILRNFCLPIILLFTAVQIWAQDPVKWTPKQNALGKTIELTFRATIDKGWYTYSQFIGDGTYSYDN